LAAANDNRLDQLGHCKYRRSTWKRNSDLMLRRKGDVSNGSMLSKKDFHGGLCAILIQETPKTDNIDSRNRRPREKSCTLIVDRRLFDSIGQKRRFQLIPAMSLMPPSATVWETIE
jgi:hypothetical protein